MLTTITDAIELLGLAFIAAGIGCMAGVAGGYPAGLLVTGLVLLVESLALTGLARRAAAAAPPAEVEESV